MEPLQCRERVSGIELLGESIEEEWLDGSLDILFGGVMRTKLATLVGRHHILEHGAEDCGADARPVEVTCCQKVGPDFGITNRHGERRRIGEEVAVDVGEGSKVVVKLSGSSLRRRVQNLEEQGQAWSKVSAVRG